MGIVKTLVESVTETDKRYLEENEIVDMFLRNRRMGRFRYKFLVKGTRRVIFVQTDRREFYSAELKGRVLSSDIKEYVSLPAADEAARQYEADGYRLVTNVTDVETILKAVMSGLRRRSSVYSRNELPIIAPMLDAFEKTMAYGHAISVDDDELEPVTFDAPSAEWAFIGRGWFRIVERK